MAAPPPLVTEISRPYWDALRERRVTLQRCGACGRHFHYPRSFCPNCGSRDVPWAEVSGRGTIYSFTLAEAPVSPDFADQAPLLLAIVELEEGVRLATDLVDADPDRVRIGDAVAPVFDDAAFEGLTVLRFRPA